MSAWRVQGFCTTKAKSRLASTGHGTGAMQAREIGTWRRLTGTRPRVRTRVALRRDFKSNRAFARWLAREEQGT